MEQLINFETAVLLKRKKFTNKVSNAFVIAGRVIYERSSYLTNHNGPMYTNPLKDSNTSEIISRPTQSTLQTWLRKKKGLFAYIDWATNEVVCLDYKNTDGKELIREDTYDYVPDHEDGEVLEKLLFETLKFIK